MKRTHHCGQLRASDIEQNVTLCGWANVVRDQSYQLFIDLRDRSGIVQIVIDRELSPELFAQMTSVKSEYCLQVDGTVRARIAGKENPRLQTGAIEVQASQIRVLNTSKALPFEIEDDVRADENVRLQYRYLDLRRRPMRDILELRHKIVKATRDFLDSEDFWEIETPLLWKSTPEGAREYVVPTRSGDARSFVLPQSPQIAKQLLMVGGVEKYFQIARCFRDESARSDRQPEFTQIDIEMSFVEQDDVLAQTERLFAYIMRTCKNLEIPIPFPRLSYEESMRRYGSDKPDTRFGLEFVDLSDIAHESGFKVFADAVSSGGQVKAICAPDCADYSRKQIDELTEIAKRFGARGLATFALLDEVKSPIAKFFSPDQMQTIFTRCGAKKGDLVLVVADNPNVVAQSLDFLRRAMAKRLGLIDADKFNFLWIVDTPMFEYSNEESRFDAMHHPFCLPNPDDMHLLDEGFTSDIPKSSAAHPWAQVRAWLYDLVLNGNEIGGGSIRIYQRELQEKMFAALGMDAAEQQHKFGFLLGAFEYGAPPHGGIAFGFDRLCAILGGSESIRDFIAFPKNNSGRDVMLDAPSTIDAKQFEELQIKLI